MEAIPVVLILMLVVVVFLSRREDNTDITKIKEKAHKYLNEAAELITVTHDRIIVKGIEYRKEQARKALTGSKEGDPVILIPEPDNKFDPKAVKVCVNGVHVGYIPRYMSREIADNITGLKRSVISGVLEFTTIPSLYIQVVYEKEKGLSEEATEFLLKNSKYL